VWSDLQTLSTSNHTAEKQIRIIATALLTLNLASITGVGPNVSATEELTKSAQRKSRIAQAEKLYTDLLAVRSYFTRQTLHPLMTTRHVKATDYSPQLKALRQILILMKSWISMHGGKLGVVSKVRNGALAKLHLVAIY